MGQMWRTLDGSEMTKTCVSFWIQNLEFWPTIHPRPSQTCSDEGDFSVDSWPGWRICLHCSLPPFIHMQRTRLESGWGMIWGPNMDMGYRVPMDLQNWSELVFLSIRLLNHPFLRDLSCWFWPISYPFVPFVLFSNFVPPESPGLLKTSGILSLSKCRISQPMLD